MNNLILLKSAIIKTLNKINDITFENVYTSSIHGNDIIISTNRLLYCYNFEKEILFVEKNKLNKSFLLKHIKNQIKNYLEKPLIIATYSISNRSLIIEPNINFYKYLSYNYSIRYDKEIIYLDFDNADINFLYIFNNLNILKDYIKPNSMNIKIEKNIEKILEILI